MLGFSAKGFQGFIAFGALVLQWLLRGRAGPRPTGLLASGRRGWEAFEANLGGHEEKKWGRGEENGVASSLYTLVH